MYNQIKRIVKEALDGINVRILIGSVSSVSPFSVNIEQRLELPKEVLIFPEHLQEVKFKTKDWKEGTEIEREYILRNKLQKGDKLVLINLGEQYLIFDKVGDIDETITITK
ncbi:DUF2577 family protein [Vallitalea sp.]|uniref:DUF2577 family protein n=1 Tax=Vallitalea sp. TaxID=1882829 RepID=UPI0025ED4049|nr:DUF2577 family protein [Vallitalea sp.]MCT4686089.1 DUF2577 domain-containing protein [Vallitalea sp.]